MVLHGNVHVARDGITLVVRRAGELLGEQACIDDEPRSATAVAIGAVRLLEITRSQLDQLLHDAAFGRNLARSLSTKLRSATEERTYRYGLEQQLFSEFRSHVSAEVLDELLSQGAAAYGRPRVADVVVLFSDIRGFTARSERLAPGALAAELGGYLDRVVEVIHDHEGLVDKFVGDAVMAIWGFRPSRSDIAVQALRCASTMVEASGGASLGGSPIEIGVGLDAGSVFMGNVGSDGKRQFTVLGSTVNTAARLESLSKELNAPIVVGQGLYDRLPPHLQAQLSGRAGVELRGIGPVTCFTADATFVVGSTSKEERR